MILRICMPEYIEWGLPQACVSHAGTGAPGFRRGSAILRLKSRALPGEGVRPAALLGSSPPHGGPLTFGEAHDDPAQRLHVLLGQLHAMKHVSQIAPHDRFFTLRAKEAGAFEF